MRLIFPDEFSNNLLPYDGEVLYIPTILDEKTALQAYKELFQTILWEHDEYKMFGKKIITKRKVAWYGSKPFEYMYSHKSRIAHLWTAKLLEIKDIIESKFDDNFNACLLNLYPNGTDGMGWHSDDEKQLVPKATIASVSLGSERKFSFKHRVTKETVSLHLAGGSLLLMRGDVQSNWLHQLPKTKKPVAPRINLTFRSMLDPVNI